jgi:aquaporin related protein
MEGPPQLPHPLSPVSPVSPRAAPLGDRIVEVGGHYSDPEVSSPLGAATTPRRSSSSRNYGGSQYRPQSRRPQHRGGYSSNDYDLPRSAHSSRSTRPLRLRERDEYDEEDDYYYEKERDYWRDEEAARADRYTRRPTREHSRPPRSYLNRPYAEMDTMPPRSNHMEETTSQRNMRVQDEEMGYGGNNKPTWKDLSAEEKAEVLRLPWTQWMNSDFKNHFVATMGEFIGTTMFLLFAFAGTEVANSK